MKSFELRKPRYEWRVLYPSGTGSDLFLADEVTDWLDVHQVDYRFRTEHEERPDHDKTLKTFLIAYIDIQDDNHALLFKLTWM